MGQRRIPATCESVAPTFRSCRVGRGSTAGGYSSVPGRDCLLPYEIPRDPGPSLAPSASDPGFLFAHEILRHRFPKTELVILSACDTAAGPLSPTQGVMSLALPFVTGGIPAVIGSLWRIDDHESYLFAVEFHRRFVTTGDVAKSLAGAQLSMLRSPDHDLHSPAAWGAFELIGTALQGRAKGGA